MRADTYIDANSLALCEMSVSETSFRQCAIVFALNEWFSPQSVKTRANYINSRRGTRILNLLALEAKVRVRISHMRR
jgi:hypothetical protein